MFGEYNAQTITSYIKNLVSTLYYDYIAYNVSFREIIVIILSSHVNNRYDCNITL